MLTQRRLFWVAIGAGLASFVWLCTYLALVYAARDDRYLVIGIENEEQQLAVVAAVGECRGRFKAVQTSETNEIWIPLQPLRTTDFKCLLENLRKAAVEIKPDEQTRSADGKVLLRPSITVRKWDWPGHP